jgi:signal peptidase I
MNVGYNTKIEDQNLTVLEDRSVESDKYVVWHVEGGLGKNIAATALIGDLKEKYPDRKLVIVVSYPEIFLNNPNIHRVYRVGSTSYFYDDYIKNKDTIVFRQEPYYQSDHIMKKKHLINNWCDLLGLNYTEQLPRLYPNAVQKNIFQGFLREKPILLLHTNGGGIGNNVSYSWSRDMPFYVAMEVAKRYENTHHIIQVSKPNTPLIPNAEHFTQHMTNFEQISLLAASDKRLLIDSSLQHAAAGMNLKSTVLWIGTSPVNYGYRMHTNITANPPKNTNKMIDSYLFDYSLEGLVHECPYDNLTEIFNLDEILSKI